MCTRMIYAFWSHKYMLVGLQMYSHILFCYLSIHIENFIINFSCDLGNSKFQWIRMFCEIFLHFTWKNEGNAFLLFPFSFNCSDIQSRNELYFHIETLLLKRRIPYHSRKYLSQVSDWKHLLSHFCIKISKQNFHLLHGW